MCSLPAIQGVEKIARIQCLHCVTKEYTGKMKTQDCSKRSMVYETWCIDCEEKAKQEIDHKNDISKG